MGLDASEDDFLLDRLGDVVNGTQFKAFFPRLHWRRWRSGKSPEWPPLQGRLSGGAADFVAIHQRHHDVQQDEVR